jgi:hypothetical protein
MPHSHASESATRGPGGPSASTAATAAGSPNGRGSASSSDRSLPGPSPAAGGGFSTITSIPALVPVMDFVVESMTRMVERTGAYGTGLEGQLGWLVRTIDAGTGFVLVHRSGAGELDGFLFAVFFADPQQPYVEVVAMAIPWRGRAFRDAGWQYVLDWARSKGAVRILTAVTRAPAVFFKRFHEPLGFRPCAIVLKVEL